MTNEVPSITTAPEPGFYWATYDGRYDAKPSPVEVLDGGDVRIIGDDQVYNIAGWTILEKIARRAAAPGDLQDAVQDHVRTMVEEVVPAIEQDRRDAHRKAVELRQGAAPGDGGEVVVPGEAMEVFAEEGGVWLSAYRASPGAVQISIGKKGEKISAVATIAEYRWQRIVGALAPEAATAKLALLTAMAETGTAEGFLACDDATKKLYFAMCVNESSRRKTAEARATDLAQEVERLTEELAGLSKLEIAQQKRANEATARAERYRTALHNLTNQVGGCVGAFEPEMRSVLSNANFVAIQLALQEAAAALSAARAEGIVLGIETAGNVVQRALNRKDTTDGK